MSTVEAGATCIGKTVMDEMAYRLDIKSFKKQFDKKFLWIALGWNLQLIINKLRFFSYALYLSFIIALFNISSILSSFEIKYSYPSSISIFILQSWILLICSINGENKHYGTPINPSAPDRVPGGSSSGSAVAVAAKLVDFSFGEWLFCTWSQH